MSHTCYVTRLNLGSILPELLKLAAPCLDMPRPVFGPLIS